MTAQRSLGIPPAPPQQLRAPNGGGGTSPAGLSSVGRRWGHLPCNSELRRAEVGAPPLQLAPPGGGGGTFPAAPSPPSGGGRELRAASMQKAATDGVGVGGRGAGRGTGGAALMNRHLHSRPITIMRWPGMYARARSARAADRGAQAHRRHRYLHGAGRREGGRVPVILSTDTLLSE